MSDLQTLYRTAVQEDWPETLAITLGDRPIEYRKVMALRYGENPHQPAAYYAPVGGPRLTSGVEFVKQGKGGPSKINWLDIDHVLSVLKYFPQPAAAFMKHLNPCGVAAPLDGRALPDVVRLARNADPRSAFGAVVGLNHTVDQETAEAILESFVEVVVAPRFTPEALAAFNRKTDLRVALCPPLSCWPVYREEGAPSAFKLTALSDGSLVVEAPYLTRIRGAADWQETPVASMDGGTVVGLCLPTTKERQDLLFAWHVAIEVRSNAIVIARHGQTLAIGTGEQERIGALEQAIAKARQKGHDLVGAVAASDGFLPFRDAVDTCADAGITAIIQPGGSKRDAEVLQAANDRKLAMVFTHERAFAHF